MKVKSLTRPSLRCRHSMYPPRVPPDCEKVELLVANGEQSELRIEEVIEQEYPYFLEDFDKETKK